MPRKTILSVICLAVLANWAPAEAPRPYDAFGDTTSRTVPVDFMRYQEELKRFDDYAESWFFIVRHDNPTSPAAPPTYSFMHFSVTNLGPGSLDATVNVYFHPHGGPVYRCHHEYDGDDLKYPDPPTSESLGIAIGPHAISGAPPRTLVRIRDDDLRADLAFENTLPPFRMGNGRIRLGDDSPHHWALALHAPRARVRGIVRAGGKAYPVDGIGYMDHNWATQKAPRFARMAHIIRVWHDDLTFILQDMTLSDRYGAESVTFALLGKDGRILAAGEDAISTATAMVAHAEAPYPHPRGYRIAFSQGDCHVQGTVETVDVLQSEDVLGNLSWGVRVAIKAFYSNPWLYRMNGRYDFQVTIGATRRRIQGIGLCVLVYY